MGTLYFEIDDCYTQVYAGQFDTEHKLEPGLFRQITHFSQIHEGVSSKFYSIFYKAKEPSSKQITQQVEHFHWHHILPSYHRYHILVGYNLYTVKSIWNDPLERPLRPERPFSHQRRFLSTTGIHTNWTCLERPPFLKDHFHWRSGDIVTDRFHCITQGRSRDTIASVVI